MAKLRSNAVTYLRFGIFFRYDVWVRECVCVCLCVLYPTQLSCEPLVNCVYLIAHLRLAKSSLFGASTGIAPNNPDGPLQYWFVVAIARFPGLGAPCAPMSCAGKW